MPVYDYGKTNGTESRHEPYKTALSYHSTCKVTVFCRYEHTLEENVSSRESRSAAPYSDVSSYPGPCLEISHFQCEDITKVTQSSTPHRTLEE